MKKHLLLSFLVGYLSCAMLRNYMMQVISDRQWHALKTCSENWTKSTKNLEDSLAMIGCYKQSSDFTTFEKIIIVYYRKDN